MNDYWCREHAWRYCEPVLVIICVIGLMCNEGYPGTDPGILMYPQSIIAEEYVQLNFSVCPENLQIGNNVKSIVFSVPQWYFNQPQLESPHRPGYVSAYLVNREGGYEYLDIRQLENQDWCYRMEFSIWEGSIHPGDTIQIIYGDMESGSPGIRFTRGNFPFGNENYKEVPFIISLELIDTLPEHRWYTASVCLNVRSQPVSLRCIGPSHAIVRAPFYLRINAVDIYGYPLIGFEDDLELTLNRRDGNFYKSIKTFKERFPAGRMHKMTMQLDEEGDYLFEVKCVSSNLHVVSNPIRCYGTVPSYQLCWGDIHGHYQEKPYDDYFIYARDAAFLDFTGLSAKSHEWTGDDWRTLNTVTDTFHSEPGFITFHGFEWASRDYGHHNVYFRGNPGMLISALSSQNVDPAAGVSCIPRINDLYDYYNNKEHRVTIIPHAVAGPFPMTMDNEGARYRHVLEIFSIWGDGETPDRESNILLPPRAQEGHFWVDALCNGLVLGVTGGSDSHIGTPGNAQEQMYHSGIPYVGITAVYTKKRTRKSLFDSIHDRFTYATTGPRIIIEYYVNDSPMGSVVTGPSVQNHAVNILAPSEILTVEVIKGETIDVHDNASEKLYESKVLKKFTPRKVYCIKEFTDTIPAGGAFYYLRIRLTDGNMAWTSPVWIDREEIG